MHRFALTTSLSLALVAFGAKISAEDSTPAGATQKLSKLLADWKVAAAEAKAQPAAEQAKNKEHFISLTKECPVGSRVGPTVVAARDVLALLKAHAVASAKDCPLANATAEQKQTEAFKAGEALMTARGKLIEDLHQLATYTSACGSDACCAEATATATGTATKVATTADSSAKCDAACSKELAARVAALKVSWTKINDDLAKLPAGKKEENMASFGAMAKSCKAVALLPASVVAMSEGFDALDTLHQKMGEWGHANPSFLASIPEEAKKAFEESNALVHETGGILRLAAERMKTMGTCPTEKAPTATAKN